jgi:hypothetical protein
MLHRTTVRRAGLIEGIVRSVATREGRCSAWPHAVLNRMKCEAEQRAEERACEAIANAHHSNGFNSPRMVGINSLTVG